MQLKICEDGQHLRFDVGGPTQNKVVRVYSSSSVHPRLKIIVDKRKDIKRFS